MVPKDPKVSIRLGLGDTWCSTGGSIKSSQLWVFISLSFLFQSHCRITHVRSKSVPSETYSYYIVVKILTGSSPGCWCNWWLYFCIPFGLVYYHPLLRPTGMLQGLNGLTQPPCISCYLAPLNYGWVIGAVTRPCILVDGPSLWLLLLQIQFCFNSSRSAVWHSDFEILWGESNSSCLALFQSPFLASKFASFFSRKNKPNGISKVVFQSTLVV